MPMKILSKCKENFESVANAPYPQNFSVGSWWENIQEKSFKQIRNFKKPQDGIDYAQTHSLSGFDHRSKEAIWTLEIKIKAIRRAFPSFDTASCPELRESSFSAPSTIAKINEIPYSNIFLSHVHYYLRSTSYCENKQDINTVLEIGGGYGALARIFQLMKPQASYTIVDLPESLFFAELFLSLNFPEAKISYSNKIEKANTEGVDFLLVPIQSIQNIYDKEFDLVINTGSLQEMPDETVRYFMDFIQSKIKVKRFYSFNYFLNNKRNFQETSGEKSNLICPILDPYWETVYFEINPLTLTIDANRRNWLEVLVERKSKENIQQNMLKENGSKNFEMAQKFPKGSNAWLEHIWMAVWLDPCEKYLKEILKGIKIFKLGFGQNNYLPSQKPFDSNNFVEVLGINKNFIKKFIKRWEQKFRFSIRKKEWYDAAIYSEEIYYQNLLHLLSRDDHNP